MHRRNQIHIYIQEYEVAGTDEWRVDIYDIEERINPCSWYHQLNLGCNPQFDYQDNSISSPQDKTYRYGEISGHYNARGDFLQRIIPY